MLTITGFHNHQANYDDCREAQVAANVARERWFSREATIGSIVEASARFPEWSAPVSGDHLGTFPHREVTPEGDPGEEIRRERIHRGTVNIWDILSR